MELRRSRVTCIAERYVEQPDSFFERNRLSLARGALRRALALCNEILDRIEGRNDTQYLLKSLLKRDETRHESREYEQQQKYRGGRQMKRLDSEI